MYLTDRWKTSSHSCPKKESWLQLAATFVPHCSLEAFMEFCSSLSLTVNTQNIRTTYKVVILFILSWEFLLSVLKTTPLLVLPPRILKKAKSSLSELIRHYPVSIFEPMVPGQPQICASALQGCFQSIFVPQTFAKKRNYPSAISGTSEVIRGHQGLSSECYLFYCNNRVSDLSFNIVGALQIHFIAQKANLSFVSHQLLWISLELFQ